MTARAGGRDESTVDAAYARLGAAIARADENRALVTEAYKITSPQTALTLRCECMHRLCTEVVALTLEEYEEQLAFGGDRPADLHDQLSWLRNTGLDAMCVHAYGNRVVLVGRKPNP